MNNVNNRNVPFSDWIRQRRLQLRLKQAEIAAELRVEPESVGHWESSRRRPELNKIPRLAAVLKTSPRELCCKALDEWFPSVYDALFGGDRDSGRKLLPAATPDGSTLEGAVIVGDRLRQSEQFPK